MDEPLADLLDVGEALAMPLTGGTGSGEIILTGISGICEDHVAIGSLISRELEAAFNRHAALMLLHEAAIGRSREALARDLHDSVAQSLAGAALRLEGLRKSIAAGHDADAEIVQLKEAFRSEQQQVRTLIDRLRSTTDDGASAELSASAGPLLQDLAKSWAIVIPFSASAPITVSVALEHEISNVLREGVANAVRHGRASKVAVDMHADQRRVVIEIADDGTGFAPDTGPEAPRSIRERIRRYGGTLDVQSGWTGTRLSISLPLGETV
jgi:signal transduction histidine kinase